MDRGEGKMSKLRSIFGLGPSTSGPEHEDEPLERALLQEGQQKALEQDMSILEDRDGSREERLQKEAEKEVQIAAEDSFKKLHVIQMGRCPVCGEHLRQHLFASICESCGWHTFDSPVNGPVKVHLRNSTETLQGDKVYVIKTGFLLVIENDLVVAKVSNDAYDYIEYIWSKDEVDQRHRGVVERMRLSCGWCGKSANPSEDGFHLVHVAFGNAQERYTFCSDECYEAFRNMYPARVHRDCYNRNCSECNLCVKRYSDEGEGIRLLAKDYLQIKK